MKMHALAAAAAVTLLIGGAGVLAGGTGAFAAEGFRHLSTDASPAGGGGPFPNIGASNSSGGTTRCDHILATPRDFSKSQVDACLMAEHG